MWASPAVCGAGGRAWTAPRSEQDGGVAIKPVYREPLSHTQVEPGKEDGPILLVGVRPSAPLFPGAQPAGVDRDIVQRTQARLHTSEQRLGLAEAAATQGQVGLFQDGIVGREHVAGAAQVPAAAAYRADAASA